jgi:hypothetical protein
MKSYILKVVICTFLYFVLLHSVVGTATNSGLESPQGGFRVPTESGNFTLPYRTDRLWVPIRATHPMETGGKTPGVWRWPPASKQGKVKKV